MLEVRDLTVRHDDRTILDRFSLVVGTGEIVAITGPSGAGKSTLLDAICGFVRIESGSILLDGRDVTGLPPHARGIVLMSQTGDLFPAMDVAANIAYGLARRRVPRHEQSRRVSALLGMIGLEGFEHRDVRSLSGGEARRVALARALAPGPAVLLLDEPLVGLDEETHRTLMADLRGVLTAAGTTVLMVTHDVEEARTIATRVESLRDGNMGRMRDGSMGT